MNKIIELVDIAIDDYGIDATLMQSMKIRTEHINRHAIQSGFSQTDAFLGEDGVMMVTAYEDDGYVGVTLEHDDSYDIEVERGKKTISYELEQSLADVLEALTIWGSKWKKND